MKKPYSFLLQFPEYYLALMFLLLGYSPPFNFHPVGMGLSCVFLLQALLANRLSGLILTTLFLFVNLLMLTPLIAEATEFTAMNSSFWQMLAGGLLLWGINLLAGGAMLYKYLKLDEQGRETSYRSGEI